VQTDDTASIRILTTGGTIDKVYTLRGELEIDEPAVRHLLEVGRSTLPVTVVPILAKDSLEFDDADRATILAAVRSSPERCVVITHGTDTLPDTARLLAAGDLGDHTVVLIGAMQPAAMRESDAAFNLGAGMMAVQLLAPGVYVVMNGRVFPGDGVAKDRAAGRFVALD
jgi:L-asparaginase